MEGEGATPPQDSNCRSTREQLTGMGCVSGAATWDSCLGSQQRLWLTKLDVDMPVTSLAGVYRHLCLPRKENHATLSRNLELGVFVWEMEQLLEFSSFGLGKSGYKGQEVSARSSELLAPSGKPGSA